MIATIYARKSTDQNGVSDEEKSVTRQVEHARAYAVKKGRTVAQVQTEGELKQVIDVLDDLAGDSRMADDLRQRAAPLAGRATRLRRELNQLILSSRLHGGCKLARV